LGVDHSPAGATVETGETGANMRIVVKFIFTLLLVIALAEAGSYAALYALSVSDKSFSKIYDPTGNTARLRGQCDDLQQTLELNPYLAFTHNKKCGVTVKGVVEYRINNLGLLGQDAEFTKEQFYTIGIFGGSVASLFAGFSSTPQLEDILNSCFKSKSGKPFRVLNFSDTAWKQPQQVIALALYGDYVDTAISIEGFNEHFQLMPGNEEDILLPSSVYSSLVNNDFFSNYYFMLSNLSENVISKSNTLKLFTFLFRKNLEKRGFDNSYSKLMEKYLMPNYVDVHEHNVKSYIGFIKSFDAIAASKNIYSLIVLQPVPLHKPLSDAEANVVGALDYEGPYQEIASLIEKHSRAFIDLSDLFSKTERTVFSDQIHFLRVDKNGSYYSNYKNGTSYGNYRMAVEIIHKLEMDNEIISRSNSRECIAKQEPL
jgi:hypothetical protein